MILAVNIGNTNIRAAIGQRQPVSEAVAFWEEVPTGDAVAWFFEEQFGGDLWQRIEGCIIASVAPKKTPVVMDAIRAKTSAPLRRIGFASLRGLSVARYKDTPGEDRVVCCVGALQKYAPPLIMIDFGTATTVNVIDAEKRFLGGAILAGLHISLEALAGRTAQLPLIEQLRGEIPLIGGSTREGLISGAVLGEAFAAEGYVARLRESLGAGTPVIVTGGHAPAILPYCTFAHIHEPNLLLSGLFALYGE